MTQEPTQDTIKPLTRKAGALSRPSHLEPSTSHLETSKDLIIRTELLAHSDNSNGNLDIKTLLKV